MALEDYIREQQAKERNRLQEEARMKENQASTRDPAEAGHWRDGI